MAKRVKHSDDFMINNGCWLNFVLSKNLVFRYFLEKNTA